MFAPPICRKADETHRERTDFPRQSFRRFDEDGGSPANIAASGSERSDTASLASEAIKLR
jgi:hypothetical protein